MNPVSCSEKKLIMDHYNFRKNICQHWIDPDFKLIQKTSLKLKHVTYREATAVYDEVTTLSGRTWGECSAIANKRKHTVTYIDCDKIYILDKDVDFRDCEKLCAIIFIKILILIWRSLTRIPSPESYPAVPYLLILGTEDLTTTRWFTTRWFFFP